MRWSCGQRHPQTPGRKQDAGQKSGHWDPPKGQTLKEVGLWGATLSGLPEQLLNEKQVAILKAGEELDVRRLMMVPGDMGGFSEEAFSKTPARQKQFHTCSVVYEYI